MILIVGLGNPGKEFSRTRHNVGFIILDEFQTKFEFSDWKTKKKLKAEISKGRIGKEEIVLAKPKTYMNASGKSVKAIISHYKLSLCNLFIVHDDLDLPFGKMKISEGKNSAGHKGVQSIIDELKTKGFVRFRIGIGTEKSNLKSSSINEMFVLKKFNKKEQDSLKKISQNVCEAIETTIKESLERAMAEFNK